MIESSAYLIVEPIRRGRDGVVLGIKIDRVVQSKPTRLSAQFVPILLTLRVDERIFLPVEPSIVVTLTDSRQIVEVSGEIPTVEAEDPEADTPAGLEDDRAGEEGTT